MIEEENLIKGAKHNLPIVTNLEDKATAIEEEYNADGIAQSIIRGLKSMIGEISNYSTCYHNKCPQTQEQKYKYDDYINLLSICNGVEICKSPLVNLTSKNWLTYKYRVCREIYANGGSLS